MESETSFHEKLMRIQESIEFATPELILTTGILFLLCMGLIVRSKNTFHIFGILSLIVLGLSLLFMCITLAEFRNPVFLFYGMLRNDNFSTFFKILFDLAGILTVLLSLRSPQVSHSKFKSEYFSLLLTLILGAHLLVMSINLVMVFISLEMLSISAYILTGFNDTKRGAEGSLKYFLFGSVASAIMVYGFSWLYGITGTVEFTAELFSESIRNNSSSLFIVAALLSTAGFLYKISAVPFHLWAPDVYEAAPLPVVALFSVVPKLAGIAVFTRFVFAFHTPGGYDWQWILGVIAMLSMAVGNFSALWQTHPQRMMAYSSIAQTGFLLIGLTVFTQNGIHYLLFYSTIFLLSNFAVFSCLQGLQKSGAELIPSFAGAGRNQLMGSVVLFIGFISLAGIPPTGGFMAKLFMFTGVWEAYEQTGSTVLIWLLIFGLVNTVISLFYYLKIPFYSFLRKAETPPLVSSGNPVENFLGLVLVLMVLVMFIKPSLLMGLLNSVNFVP